MLEATICYTASTAITVTLIWLLVVTVRDIIRPAHYCPHCGIACKGDHAFGLCASCTEEMLTDSACAHCGALGWSCGCY